MQIGAVGVTNDKMPDIINSLLDKVSAVIDKYSMIPSGGLVMVALSGGADSVCLLDILIKLGKTKKFSVCAAHLNHMIRGDEAQRDQKFCEELCNTYDVMLYIGKVDVPALARKECLSEEEAGRRARYDFFAKTAKEHDINVIATAHNRNDRAETVLMRIIRGTGISGLRGIRYKRDDGVIRPLLDVTRNEIEEYCAAAKLKYITDSTNSDIHYTRNNIRRNLVPYIQEEFNPNIINSLCNLSDSAMEDGDFMEGYAERLYARLRPPLAKGDFKALHIDSLKMVSQKSIISRLIMLCARDAMGDSEGNYKLEKKHIEAVHKIISGESSGAKLPGGLRVTERYGWLEFSKPKDSDIDPQSLNSCNNMEFCVEVGTDRLYNIDRIGAEISITLIGKEALSAMDGDILLDSDKLGLDDERIKTAAFKLRSRIPGDRIAVYKNGKTKKIKNLFIDRKIPREERVSIPVLCLNDEIIAVPGVRVSEIYKPDKHTKNYLVVHYER